MSSGAGGSPLCEKLFWIPTVYSRTDVNALSMNNISFRRFFCVILLKPCLNSESCSRALRLKVIHLHFVSFGWKMAYCRIM